MNVEIRIGGQAEVEAIAQFQVDMAMESENLQLDKATVLKGVAAVVDDSSKGTYYVAFASEPDAAEPAKAVGSLMLTKEWSDWNNGFYWWIQSVYVMPEYRGKGVFKRLFAKVTEDAQHQSVPQVRLYVDKTNHRAQQCYQKLGMMESHYLLYEK